MSVHYKFKSALEYDTVTFDGLHISVHDLKKAILHQKRIGKNTDFDLQVTNAQTKEVYTDDSILIPKNTSLIVARIPLTTQQKKAWERAESNQLSGLPKGVDGSLDGQDPGVTRLAKAVDLSSLDASEEDKIQAMMTQSTQDYSPSNYMRIRGACQVGEVPSSYRCFKCHQPGHWIKNCPLGLSQEPIEIKKSTGIPRSFMVPVEGPGVPGAMMTPTGQFAVPAIDHQAYKEGKKERPPFQQEPEPTMEKPEIPEDLLCTICKDLLTDAVMIPCCGNSFCDECARTVLLESEDHECPDCKEKDVSPDTLIPNRFLRNAVNNFKNETGYNKSIRQNQRPPLLKTVVQTQPVQVIIAPPAVQQIPLETAAPATEYSEPPPGDTIVSSKVEVITSTGITVHPPHLQPVAAPVSTSTIPVLGARPQPVERAHVRPTPAAPASQPPQAVPPPASVSQVVPPGIVQHPVPTVHQKETPAHHQEPGHTSQRGPPIRQHVQLVPQPPGVGTAPVATPGNSGPPPPGVPGHVLLPPGHETQPQAPTSAAVPAQPAAPPQAQPHAHPIHPSAPRRSVEERPGTPTIDEHNQDVQAPSLPDTSVPPPNFPPGEEPPFTAPAQQPAVQPAPPASQPPAPSYHIETLGARSQPRPHGHPYRVPPEHPPFGPHPGGPHPGGPHPGGPHPGRNYGRHYDHGPPYHHEPGPRPPHYNEMERDHPVRGSYRGYHRGRGRAMHGGYRGSHLHHQPPPPGLGRGVHNGNQAGRTIDDPLEAFERMLREKDERDHKLRRTRRSRTRSYTRSRSRSTSSRSYTRSRSRSRTRSRSRSRTRTPRSRSPRSRTPRKRSRTRTRTRSRSRSFTISRSRSRSFSRSPTPRAHSPRSSRDYSPRRRASPRYRTPPRSPPRYQRPYKDVRADFEPAPYYEPPEYTYPARGGGRGRGGGRFGPRKDFSGGANKDYYDENYSNTGSRFGDRYGIPPAVGGGARDIHHRGPIEPLMPPGVTSRYESQPTPTFRRYDHYDVAPPGTGPDIPGIGPYEKPRYDRPPGVGSSYDRPGSYDNRSSTHEDFLTPPGVDHRYGGSRERDRDRGSRERDIAPPGVRDRDIGPPGVRDRDRDLGLRDRDIGPPGVRERDLPPSWDRDRGREDAGVLSRDRDAGRDKERDVRDSDRDRDRGSRDYYESDHRRSYESKSYSYNSPESKKRRQSLSPPRHGGTESRERYSSGERHHRHGGRSDSRRKMGSSQQGKENRQQLSQPVETVVDAMGQRDKDKESGGQKRERVLVEVRKEPSVDRDRSKKDDKNKSKEELEDKNKKSKDKKKKKKEKEVDGEKLKKKKRKEKKEGKKDSALEAADRNKADNVKKDKQPVHKAREDKQESASEGKTEADTEKRKPVAQSDKLNKPAILRTFDAPPSENMVDGLYGDMEDTRIDDTVIANYGKVIAEEGSTVKVKEENKGTESGVEADGLESNEGAESLGMQQGEQVVKEENIEEARVKSEGGSDSDGAKSEKANVMLAPMPEPSKWELEEEFTPSSTFEKKDNDDRASTGSTGVDKGSAGKVVTSEVLKRAENAIFQKAINAIRPIEPTKKATGDRKIYTGAEKEKRLAGEVVVASAAESTDPSARKLLDKDTREARKTANSIQITIPIAGNHAERSVEISSVESSQQASKNKGKPERQKFTGGSGGSQWGDASDSMSPHRVSAKERLGARVDGENEKKHDDERSRSRNIGRHRSRSESRDRKHGTSKKGLKSTVEKKRTVSRSRSRSPHHGRKVLDRKHQDAVDPRRYTDGRYVEAVPDRKYAVSSERGTDLRSKRMEREARYIEGERHIQERGNDVRRREHSETKKEVTKSPERRRERSDSRDRKSDKTHVKQKEEREKSVEKVKKHKTKKKTKRRSESRSRKKSVSDRELKRGKKKDKKHKKDKGKKHKGNEKEKSEKEEEKGDKETGDLVATKDSKAGISTNEVTDAAQNEPSGTAEDDHSKEKTRKGGRRNPRLASDRKKSTLDEASFEPDYDASSSVDTEAEEGVEGEKKIEGTDKKTAGSKDASPSEGSPTKKRDRSTSADPSEQKRPKLEKDSEKAEKVGGEETSKKSNGGNGKSGTGSKSSSKKRGRSVSSSDSSDEDSSDDDDDSSSGSSSSSDDDSSDDSSVHRRRKKKSRHRRRGKRSKKSSRRASNSSSDSDSESESGSSSDSGSGRGRRGSGRSKKHKHRSKASKKKKKSKHR